MTDAELVAELRTRLQYHELQAERCRQALAVFEDDGALGRRYEETRARRQGAKPAKAKPAHSAEKKTAGAAARAERKAKGLAMLKAGKTPNEVAEALGVTVSAVYLWRQ